MVAESVHSISGTVINEQGLPIENVTISIKNPLIQSTSDSSGYFIIILSNPKVRSPS